MAVDPFGGRAASDRDEADDFLGGNNYTTMVAAKWHRVGFVFKGTLLAWDGPVQRTDMNSGELLWFENKKLVKDSEVKNEKTARPSQQLLMDFQLLPDDPQIGMTWKGREHDEEVVPDDDGTRRAYVFGELLNAIVEARKEAAQKLGLPEGALAPLEKGVFLEIARGKNKKYTGSGFSGHTFKARWTPAAGNPHFKEDADSFLEQGETGGGNDEGDPFA